MTRMMIFAAAALFATPASASQRIIVVNGVPTAHVSYADLNLHSSSGQGHMARRIRAAAEQICVGAYVETSIFEPPSGACYVAAVASGIGQMNDIASR